MATLTRDWWGNSVILFALLAGSLSQAEEPIPPIARRLPPQGIQIDAAERAKLEQELQRLQVLFEKRKNHTLAPDVDVYLQAVRLALQFGEFYNNKDMERAHDLLATASDRLKNLSSRQTPWTTARGLVVRGYRSSVDGSSQPYGLVIPENLDLDKPVPLYVWLHGRGDKNTNLTFLHQRQTQVGKIAPSDAIVVHPWGRHCVGYKSAGEIDVLEAVDHVASQYPIDRRRIVLMGFSMGGAGCWHLGAHYADRWVAMSPGAGFAETARYQRIDPQTVPSYERLLWGVYDVPDYTLNLFNLPVIAYSGENDKQIQAARVMEEAFTSAGRTLDHRIGPGMGHAYHPDTLKKLLGDLKEFRNRGLDPSPPRVTLQTRTLRYHKLHWVDIRRLDEHWQDTRVDAQQSSAGHIRLTTKNVACLRLSPDNLPADVEVVIDGQKLHVSRRGDGENGGSYLSVVKRKGAWADGLPDETGKRPGLQGPIDDAFVAPFLVVLPSGKCRHPKVERWVKFEQAHFLSRWEALLRGKPRVKFDKEVTAEDRAKYHLILWGDPAANSVLHGIVDKLPITWTADLVGIGTEQRSADSHALLMIYPNPEAPNRYVVLNSGPTFREGHDRTNSLQNPKLPDWALIDLSQLPDGLSAGRVLAADFFDERWQVRRP